MKSIQSVICILLSIYVEATFAFLPSQSASTNIHHICRKQREASMMKRIALFAGFKDDGVVELADDEDEGEVTSQAVGISAPFLSQGEILEESLQLTNDPKQTRVIGYIVASLIPVLFLIPLMLGSRDLIPLEALPPVDI